MYVCYYKIEFKSQNIKNKEFTVVQNTLPLQEKMNVKFCEIWSINMDKS